MQKVRTAVVGAGKMGGIHSKVYSQIDQSEFIGVVDVDKQKADAIADQYNCQSFNDPAELIGKVDAVTISAPTIAHLELAKFFIENKISVLIEKPLAATAKEGEKIVALADKYDVVLAVGHSERCNPVVQAMKRLNIKPKFIEAIRVSPYPFRSTDIGVVLDVMIHDIDIVLAFAQDKLKKVEAVGVNVIAEHEDICNARVSFENGCVANITASRIALATTRKVRVFSRQAYLNIDYLKKEGLVVKADKNIDVVKWVKEHQDKGDFDFSKTNWPELLHIEQLDIDEREPLRVEQESFLDAVIDRTKHPEVTGEEGLAALECAEMILESLNSHEWGEELPR
jgi:predicted dehydrogenase